MDLTEEKIKKAALKIFSRKGFDGTTTREIAKEAGISSAALHYYFRRKDKLFAHVLAEEIAVLFKTISSELKTDKLSLNKKIELFTISVTDYLIKKPDFPLFILNELNSTNLKIIYSEFKVIDKDVNKVISFLNRLEIEIEKKLKSKMAAQHTIFNILSLTIAPFVLKPLFTDKKNNLFDEECVGFIEKRKEYIPIWIENMMRGNIKY